MDYDCAFGPGYLTMTLGGSLEGGDTVLEQARIRYSRINTNQRPNVDRRNRLATCMQKMMGKVRIPRNLTMDPLALKPEVRQPINQGL